MASKKRPNKKNKAAEQSTFADIAVEEIAEVNQHEAEAKSVPQDSQVADLSRDTGTDADADTDTDSGTEELEATAEAEEVFQATAEEEPPQEAEEVYQEVHQEGDTYPRREKQSEKMRLEFFGSEVIRAQAPQVMDFADKLADDWVNEGNFEELPVPNPLAQAVLAKGLQKAKEVEKKLEEKGVFMMARMGADYLKSKIKK